MKLYLCFQITHMVMIVLDFNASSWLLHRKNVFSFFVHVIALVSFCFESLIPWNSIYYIELWLFHLLNRAVIFQKEMVQSILRLTLLLLIVNGADICLTYMLMLRCKEQNFTALQALVEKVSMAASLQVAISYLVAWYWWLS